MDDHKETVTPVPPIKTNKELLDEMADISHQVELNLKRLRAIKLNLCPNFINKR